MTADSPAVAPARPEAPAGQGPLHILVVDDSAAIRAFMQAKLRALASEQQLELAVATATSGEEAVSSCDGHDYDLVFMDVVMPGMGGIEACRLIKARHTLPVTMVSSLRAPEDHAAARAAGCDAYLDKPVKDADLLAVVRQAAQRQRAPS